MKSFFVFIFDPILLGMILCNIQMGETTSSFYRLVFKSFKEWRGVAINEQATFLCFVPVKNFIRLHAHKSLYTKKKKTNEWKT